MGLSSWVCNITWSDLLMAETAISEGLMDEIWIPGFTMLSSRILSIEFVAQRMMSGP